MSHFAEIDADGVVLRVIVAEQDFIDTLPGKWLQSSYNTHGGVHVLGGTPFRKNYAGIGYTYDSVRDAFIPPRPDNATGLDEQSCLWIVPEQPPGGMV